MYLTSTTWQCRLKEETKVTDSSYHPFRLQNQYADGKTSCTTTSSGIMNLTAEDLSIRTPLGCFVGRICINLLLTLKCGLNPFNRITGQTVQRATDLSILRPGMQGWKDALTALQKERKKERRINL